jgi:tetratricopeptide (TPR) repeat protein
MMAAGGANRIMVASPSLSSMDFRALIGDASQRVGHMVHLPEDRSRSLCAGVVPERFSEPQGILVDGFPSEPAYQQYLARSLPGRGILHKEGRRFRQAEEDYHRAISFLETLTKGAHSRPVYRYELASACNNLGILYSQQERYREAKVVYGQPLGLLQSLVRDFAARPLVRYELTNTHNSLGTALAKLPQTSEAEA